MSTLDGLPEHILHDVIAAVIDSTRFRGWQLSLRLVDHRFNEAVLHVYYLRKRLVVDTGGHSFDCRQPCHYEFCRARASSRLRITYGVRFTFQSFLASRILSGDATQAFQLQQQWQEALTTLRGVNCVQLLDSDQVRFYSTCSSNPIFNDTSSAILSEAVRSCLGPIFLTRSARGEWVLHLPNRYQACPTTFWVALCACVLGDPESLDICVSKLARIVDKDPFSQHPSDPSVAEWLIDLLRAAILHAKPHLVSHILGQHSSMIPEIRTKCLILHTAIFANNKEVLEAVLKYTPNSPNLLAEALRGYSTLLPRSSSSSETIRLLARHFDPRSAESRTWLIMHSCSVGDVTLLQEFLDTGPLFDHRIFDAGGLIPAHIHFAISCGNADSLRFLLDHGVIGNGKGQRMQMAIEQALSFNQIECYRELYKRFDEPRSARYFWFLGWAANSEGIMADFISEDKNILFERFEDQKVPLPTVAERALWNSIQRLRPESTRLLLDEGACIFPWPHPKDWEQSGDPCEIPWPYFNQNRDAFIHTQAVLDAFGLPKLRILV